jgi:hypothetical protein
MSLSKLCNLKALLGIIILSALTGCSRGQNEHMTFKAEKLAMPSADYPLAGFWKSAPSDDFGVAIAPAGNGLYSVSFCGPGGCFEPGTYRPNSKIYGDQKYKVIDVNTVEIGGQAGFDRYYRFESRTSTQQITGANSS